MKKNKQILLFFSFIFLISFSLVFGFTKTVFAMGSDGFVLSPSDLINGINAYRAQNGLYAFSTNGKLAAAAQAQAEYQSSLGHWTHTGADGSSPIDRAYAYGYGNGETIFVSEITYCGSNGTPSSAIAWWKTSSVHNYYMLTNEYVEVGAGQASGNVNCFTVLMGYVAGGSAPAQGLSSWEDPASAVDVPHATVGPLIIPVTKSEPRDDGSIVHVVQAGQAMWNIWALYAQDDPSLTIEQLYEMNDLSVWDFLIEGTELVIQEAHSNSSDYDSVTTNDAGNSETETLDLAGTPEPTLMTNDTPTPRPTITLMAMMETTPSSDDVEIDTLATEEETQNHGFLSNFTVYHWALVGVFALMCLLFLVAFLSEEHHPQF